MAVAADLARCPGDILVEESERTGTAILTATRDGPLVAPVAHEWSRGLTAGRGPRRVPVCSRLRALAAQ
ncbi:hypothetical protein AB0N42_12690 [Streptomyces pseudogriseolus]|uniref:hypothetical protein n=1 Tax=Streptomyces pseudogriseolus TaxID=36817 RepID=UPI0034740E38